MIWLPKRPKYHPGWVNCILAFRRVGFQLMIDDLQGKDGWVIDLIPGLCIARNPWIVFGSELRLFVVTIGFFITTKRFNEGLVEEKRVMEKLGKEIAA